MNSGLNTAKEKISKLEHEIWEKIQKLIHKEKKKKENDQKWNIRFFSENYSENER